MIDQPDCSGASSPSDSGGSFSGSDARVLVTLTEPKRVTGLALTGCGTVMLGLRTCRPVLIGEILHRRIRHPEDPQRGFLEGGESVLNYEVLGTVHVNTVRAALRRVGITLPLEPGLMWVKVHGD